MQKILILIGLLCVLNGKAQTDTIRWQELAPLPDTLPRFIPACFVIDSDLYVAGGQISYTDTNISTVWQYHIPSNIWTRKRDLPFGVASCGGSFALNGKGYFLVARDSNQLLSCSKAFWEYDAVNDLWARMQDFPDSPRQNSVSYVYDNKGYVGETYGCGFPDGHFWTYDAIQNQWSEIDSLPQPIVGVSAGTSNNLTSYVLGGTDDGGNPFNNLWSYDTIRKIWHELTPLSGPGRANALAWGFDNILLAGGGWTHDSTFSYNLLNDFYKYNVRADTWFSVVFVNSFDSAAGGYCFVFNNIGYYFGGYSSLTPYTYTNKLWSFDATKYLSKDSTVGIQEVNNDFTCKVYPNPLHREKTLNIQCSEFGEIIFYDLLGRILYQGAIRMGLNNFDCYQISGENNVLLYRIKIRSGQTESGKLVFLQ